MSLCTTTSHPLHARFTKRFSYHLALPLFLKRQCDLHVGLPVAGARGGQRVPRCVGAFPGHRRGVLRERPGEVRKEHCVCMYTSKWLQRSLSSHRGSPSPVKFGWFLRGRPPRWVGRGGECRRRMVRRRQNPLESPHRLHGSSPGRGTYYSISTVYLRKKKETKINNELSTKFPNIGVKVTPKSIFLYAICFLKLTIRI